MNPILIDGPAVEPIPVAEMKAYLRLDEDDTGQDELIAGLVKAARLMVEAASRRALIAQRWRVMRDAWPQDGVVMLPVSPLIAVDGIKVFDAAGIAVDIPAAVIESDRASDPPRLRVADPPLPGQPRNGIVIDCRAGYGTAPDAVPAPLRLAIKMLVARWFENRGDGAGEQALPPDALALIAPFRRPRL